ncbi:hypothetical protein F4604DRAFT_1698287 [Suillus subluteus]|nr:hypothetical protein F4604DRAFT_1698287 [Suillus subluteus]
MGNTNRVVVEFASDVPALGSAPKILIDNKATHGASVHAQIDGGLESETSGHDGVQSVEEATSSTPGVMMPDEYDYGPFDVINFGIPNELLPSTSTPALVAAGTSLTANISALVSSTDAHRELGSGLPRGLQAMRNTTRFSTSRSGFNILVKPKHNPWDRK